MDRNKYSELLNILTEAESVVGDVTKIDTDVLVSQIKAMESGSNQAKVEFLNDLKKRYKITGPASMTSTMKKLCMGLTGFSMANGVLGMISKAYISAMKFSGGDVAGGILSLAGICMASLTLFIFYKIFNIVKNTDVTESVYLPANRIKYKKLLIKKSLLESDRLFNRVNYIAESHIIRESASDSIISRAYVLCKDMLKKITSGVSNFIKNHPAFTAAILICIGMITMYVLGKPAANPTKIDVTSKIDQAGLGSKNGSVNFNHPDLSYVNGGSGVSMFSTE